MNFRERSTLAAGSLLFLLVSLPTALQPDGLRSCYREWRAYGGGSDNIHYSLLDQINRSNVQKLEIAWTFDSGDAMPDYDMECNPIVVHGVLFGSTPKLRVVALDAATGKR